jgi:hypothetical protein
MFDPLLRQVAAAAADLDWDLRPEDVVAKARAQRSRSVFGGRFGVVLVAAAILVVFFVPLPHLDLFKHLVNPAKASNATTAPTKAPKGPPIGTRLAELEAPDAATSSGFGRSVAISGRTGVVADLGGVYVFSESRSNWRQVAELNVSDTSAGACSTTAGFGVFGYSVAISGTTVVVGAACADAAYVFTKSATGWTQTAALEGSDTSLNDEFVTSVAVSGSVIVVGANSYANSAGRAYVFTRRSGSWRQVAELKGSDTVAGDEIGYAVAVSGMTVVVGVYQAGGVGRAYVFTEAAGSWEQVAELKGSDTVAGDDFGYAVAVSGTTVLVGASNASRVYVFTKSATG